LNLKRFEAEKNVVEFATNIVKYTALVKIKFYGNCYKIDLVVSLTVESIIYRKHMILLYTHGKAKGLFLINKPDKELMQDFQQGNTDAFVELYRRHKQGLWLYCLKMVGDESGASDVFQDVLVKVIYKKESYSGNGSVAGWLFKIARNHCLNFKSRHRHNLSLDDFELKSFDDVESTVETREHFRLIYYYIDKLSNSEKEAILLHDMNGFSYDEISSITQSTIEAVRMRVYRARKQLRNWLEPILFPGGFKFQVQQH